MVSRSSTSWPSRSRLSRTLRSVTGRSLETDGAFYAFAGHGPRRAGGGQAVGGAGNHGGGAAARGRGHAAVLCALRGAAANPAPPRSHHRHGRAPGAEGAGVHAAFGGRSKKPAVGLQCSRAQDGTMEWALRFFCGPPFHGRAEEGRARAPGRVPPARPGSLRITSAEKTVIWL